MRVFVAGARAAVCDALDAAALRDAVVVASPDVIVHQLTALPPRLDPRDRRVYEATNRLRRDGTANLLAAARAARTRRFLCQSIAFAYAPTARPRAMAEEAPLFLTAPPPSGDGVRSTAEMERALLEADGLDALVLRCFYGPTRTSHATAQRQPMCAGSASRSSARAAKCQLGFEPNWPSWRQGFREAPHG